jgi:hypothetical protein
MHLRPICKYCGQSGCKTDGAPLMTEDSDMYRINAEQCLIMAERAASPDIRAGYLDLAKRWEQLAAAADKLAIERRAQFC